MGNQFTCMASSKKSVKNTHILRKHRRSENESQPHDRQEQMIQQQALALAMMHQKSVMNRVDRAMSQRFSDVSYKDRMGFSRSSSARPRSTADPHFVPLKPEHADMSNIESKHFVLVHGGGYGAWCWYKSIALLEEYGFITTAVDLTGSGIESTDPNLITTLSQYTKPLLDLLDKLPNEEKVILVGHDFGGACVSYAMECYPHKISKAIFVAAVMPGNMQRAFDALAPELMSPEDLLTQAQVFSYANGDSKPPTTLSFDKNVIKELFFNHSPAKDVALASVSLRPVPFAPILERLELNSDKYGAVRRFYVQSTDDNALSTALQERIIEVNPPERVFKVKGSDHAPFFSKPQSLHKFFIEIAQL